MHFFAAIIEHITVRIDSSLKVLNSSFFYLPSFLSSLGSHSILSLVPLFSILLNEFLLYLSRCQTVSRKCVMV